MNVKPGDLARIVHPSLYGKFVNVLYETPAGPDYTLPDGVPALRLSSSLQWVCEAHGAPVDCPMEAGRRRLARYVSVHDKWLRPIRGLDGEDEILTLVGKPEAVTA